MRGISQYVALNPLRSRFQSAQRLHDMPYEISRENGTDKDPYPDAENDVRQKQKKKGMLMNGPLFYHVFHALCSGYGLQRSFPFVFDGFPVYFYHTQIDHEK